MTEETIIPQWICMTCKTVIGPIVDDEKHKCKCKDVYLFEHWRVAAFDPEALQRIHRLLEGLQIEASKLSAADDKARTLAIMKINIVGYMTELWPNRAAFEKDIAMLETAFAPARAGE